MPRLEIDFIHIANVKCMCVLNSLRVADLCQYLTPYNVSSSQMYGDGIPSTLVKPDQIPSFVNIEYSLTIIELPCRSLAFII